MKRRCDGCEFFEVLMTEAEWLACNDPGRMIGWLNGHAGHTTPIPDDVLRSWVWACRLAHDSPGRHDLSRPRILRQAVGDWCSTAIGQNLPLAIRADLLREVAGNPFRPVTLPPSWLTPQVRALAEAALAEKKPGQELDPLDLLPVADALEEAGCTEEELLRHLRGQEPCAECGGKGGRIDTGGERGETMEWFDCDDCVGTGWRPLRGPHVAGCWALALLGGDR